MAVSSTGVYLVRTISSFITSINQNITFRFYINGSVAHSQIFRGHSATDPHAAPMEWVGKVVAAPDAIKLTMEGEADNVNFEKDSTLIIQRLA